MTRSGFFEAFEGMEQGFRDRAANVEQLLANPSTAFVVIASPRRDAVAEATYLADRLRESSGSVAALVVNRMFPNFGLPGEVLLGQEPSLREGPPASVLASLVENLRDLAQVGGREEQYVELLAERLPGTPIVRVPFLADDVHDTAASRRSGTACLPGTAPKAESPLRLWLCRSLPGRRC